MITQLRRASVAGCRPGGDLGLVAISMLAETYETLRATIGANGSVRDLRRSKYDLRKLAVALFAPGPELLRPQFHDPAYGALATRHLHAHGLGVDELHADISLGAYVAARRGVGSFQVLSYALSVNDLAFLETLRSERAVHRGLDRTLRWMAVGPVLHADIPVHGNSTNTTTGDVGSGSGWSLPVRVMVALGWTAGMRDDQMETLHVLVSEWDGTARELLRTAAAL